MIAMRVKGWLVAVAIAVLAAGGIRAAQERPAGGALHAGFGGIWVISSDPSLRGPDAATVPDAAGGGSGRRGGRNGGGGRPGGGGSYGGRGGGYGGGSGSGRGGRSEEGMDEREAILNYSRTLLQPAKQMTIVPHQDSLAIAYEDGRTLTLETTNKKVSGRAENGFVKVSRKSKWVEDALVSEVEIENGAKFVEKYEVVAEGTQLRVSITAEGSGGRGGDDKRTITHVYERPEP
jgi:hypothetical protein